MTGITWNRSDLSGKRDPDQNANNQNRRYDVCQKIEYRIFINFNPEHCFINEVCHTLMPPFINFITY